VTSAQSVLDHIRSLARLEELEARPESYVQALTAEVLQTAGTLADLEARDATLAHALTAIDTMIARAMRFVLEHALAGDTSIGAPTRNVFASTVVSYIHQLDVLRGRARDVAARGRAADPDEIARVVVECAERVLVLRGALRAGVLALVRDLANAAVPDADRRARDRNLDDGQRKRWSAARRDQEMIGSDPERILAAPMPARLAAWPEQLDEPAPEAEASFADMIEID